MVNDIIMEEIFLAIHMIWIRENTSKIILYVSDMQDLSCADTSKMCLSK